MGNKILYYLCGEQIFQDNLIKKKIIGRVLEVGKKIRKIK